MQNTSELSFLVEPLSAALPEALAVTPVLDGVPLTKLIDDFETNRGFDAAGGYAGLVPGHYRFGPLNCHFLADSDEFDLAADWEIPDVYLLGCTCGEVGCWPLTSTITKSANTVTWSDFGQPHRPNRLYTAFGPFHFEFTQYEAAVNALAKQFYPKETAPKSTAL
jgi:hypothetical protein